MSIPIAAWIKEGDSTRSVLFQAPPGRDTWVVYYTLGDGQGTPTAMTTPTVTEISANQPGCYSLDIDETAMVTRSISNNFETVCLYISASGWPGTAVSYVLYNENP